MTIISFIAIISGTIYCPTKICYCDRPTDSYYARSQVSMLTHCTHLSMNLLQTNVPTWTSAASPGPAPSRDEAFRFSSWKRKFRNSFFFRHSKYFSKDKTTRMAGGRRTVFTAHLFQEVPGFLCEVRWKAEFALQDFVNCLLSVFPSEWRLWNTGTNNG